MYIKNGALLALATGFAAAKPVSRPEELPAYKRDVTPVKKRSLDVFGNGFSGDFDIFGGFNDFQQQQQVVNIREEQIAFVDNGFQQQIVQQAQEVLVIDSQNNGFNNKFNDLSRKAAFRNNFPDQETVALVVQQIDIQVDDGFGNQIEQSVFAQSAVVANRGAFATQTVMVFASTAIVAQNVFDNFGRFGGQLNGFGIAAPTAAAGFGNTGNNQQFAIPTATNDVQFFGQKPTWSSVLEDPANTAAAAWQAELEDAKNVENQNLDNEVNAQVLEQEKAGFEQGEEENVDEEQNVEDEQNVDEQQNAEEEQQQAEEEQQQAEEDAAAAEEEAAQQEQEQAAQQEQEQVATAVEKKN